VINAHEHIESRREAGKLLNVMDRLEIETTVLLGSSWFTITLNPSVGFTRYDENNEEILALSRLHAGRFEAWPTIDPLDTTKLDKIKSFHERGATGLKLYLGHGFVSPLTHDYLFHTIAMDDERMFPVYQYCTEHTVPVCFHVNPGPRTPGFLQEFLTVLCRYPDLLVIAPHWALSSIRMSRLRELLRSFPNLLTDISFGHDDYLIAGLRRISRSPASFRQLLVEFSDRVLFGTDLVITSAARKTERWIESRIAAYLSVLRCDIYRTELIPGVELRGLDLDDTLVQAICEQNYRALRRRRPAGTPVPRSVDWEAMGVAPVARSMGMTFHPLEGPGGPTR
jgi:predicted TIM-barrel fold metal-dependent hydrolase